MPTPTTGCRAAIRKPFQTRSDRPRVARSRSVDCAATSLPAASWDVGGPRPVGSFQRAKSSLIAEFERRYLEDALSASGGNIARAARTAGKPRRAFFELMRKHGISAKR